MQDGLRLGRQAAHELAGGDRFGERMGLPRPQVEAVRIAPLAGHSAGGYEGMSAAMHGAGKYADAISDVTLMDSNYAEAHYDEAVKWMFKGNGGKKWSFSQSREN